ncbi:MAG: DUF2089 domain-containing protein [Anaerolineae bacterium]|nr:DUF2089 domain-containing protein [Anaerolineae bacterium]CAG1008562.1 hypothetical protein ANRL4_03904 [Anaerolineae bacterium]
MHPVLGTCPVCGEPLAITRLHCRACDTTIEGQFYTGRLSQLTPEQLEFVEVFLVCEGKIKAVEERLGKSYPTIRNKMREVIAALGYDITEDESNPPPAEEARKRILDQLQGGQISYEEALALLRGE